MFSETNENLPIQEIISFLENKLPAIGQKIIKEHLDLSVLDNQQFFENPDDFSQHEYHWHQWGIISHTKEFIREYKARVPKLLQEWGIDKQVETYLSDEIDGRSKDELLQIGILLHDLGKFGKRRIKGYDVNGKPDFSFAGHAQLSAEIIETEEFSRMLRIEYGLTESQIKYIRECARIHFDVAGVRDKYKKIPGSYTVENMTCPEMNEEYNRIIAKCHPFEIEAGLLFMGDTLSKVDSEPAENVDELKREVENYKQKYSRLDPNLSKAVLQKHINLCVARRFLEIALSIDQSS